MLGIVLDIPAKDVIKKQKGKLLLTKSPDIDEGSELFLLENGKAYGILKFGKSEKTKNGLAYSVEVVTSYGIPRIAKYEIDSDTSLCDIDNIEKEGYVNNLSVLKDLVTKSLDKEDSDKTRTLPQDPVEATLQLNLTEEDIYLDILYPVTTDKCGTIRLKVDRDGISKKVKPEAIKSLFNINGSRFTKDLTESLEVVKVDDRSNFWLSAEGEVPSKDGTSHIVHLGKGKVEFVSEDEVLCYCPSVSLKGYLTIDGDKASLDTDLTPRALRSKSVVKSGQTNISKSLQADIPPMYRWWNASSDEEATVVKNAFLDSGKHTYAFVDGKLRKLLSKYFVSDNHEEGELFTENPLELVKSSNKHVIDLTGEESSIEEAVQTIKNLPAEETYLVVHHDTAENRYHLDKLGKVFGIVGSDLIFCAADISKIAKYVVVDVEVPEQLHVADSFTTQQSVNPDELVQSFLDTEICKAAVDETVDERYVLGIVLEPETVDSQSDIYSEEEIRKTAHKFMQDFKNIGYMHKSIINDKVKIVETYLSPVDFEMNGQPVKKGTWLLGVKIMDDGLWQEVKTGKLTAFSMGGSAIRKPENM